MTSFASKIDLNMQYFFLLCSGEGVNKPLSATIPCLPVFLLASLKQHRYPACLTVPQADLSEATQVPHCPPWSYTGSDWPLWSYKSIPWLFWSNTKSPAGLSEAMVHRYPLASRKQHRNLIDLSEATKESEILLWSNARIPPTSLKLFSFTLASLKLNRHPTGLPEFT
jgi:hypothetical protein